jgi:hypothetical protein
VKSLRTTIPASRPFKMNKAADLKALFSRLLTTGDGATGAHCIHEFWMRGEMGVNIEPMLEQLWKACGASVPNWLPMRHVEWLPQVYEVASHFKCADKGRSNIYLILLDYRDRRADPYGVYVGMSAYSAAERFDQHKAGIRAAGSVLKRGIEPLTGPVMHLQKLKRAAAERIEVELGEALTAAGLFVQGGH